MSITWRPAIGTDLEEALAIQPLCRGDAQTGTQAALKAWKRLLGEPFFASAVFESSPAIGGHRLLGFGASVMVSREFADAEMARPRPDLSSRIIAGFARGEPLLATRNEVARANAAEGVNIAVLTGGWRDEILNPEERYQLQIALATSFVDCHTGHRIRIIFKETADLPELEFIRHSMVYRTHAEFSECGRVLHVMTRESVQVVQAHLGNVLFGTRTPLLRLRESDQELLLAALKGATDAELAAALAVNLPAVKGRWRSIFARIAELLPDLTIPNGVAVGRGEQKRHRVLAYMRNHPEELRPYEWKALRSVSSAP